MKESAKRMKVIETMIEPAMSETLPFIAFLIMTASLADRGNRVRGQRENSQRIRSTL